MKTAKKLSCFTNNYTRLKITKQETDEWRKDMTIDNVSNTNRTQNVNTSKVNKKGEVPGNKTTDGVTKVDIGSGVTISFGSSGGPTLSLPPQMNTTDLMTLLYALNTKTTESRMNTTEKRIKQRGVETTAKHEKIIQNMKDKAANNSDVGKIFAQIFGWIGVVVAVIGAVVAGVLSGGAAAAPLIGAAVLTATMLILQESGGMDKMMEGLSDSAKIGTSAGLAALMLIINIGAAVLSAGIASGGVATAATQLAGEAAEIGVSIAEKAGDAGIVATKIATNTMRAVKTLGKIATTGAKSAKLIYVAQKIGSVATVVGGGAGVAGGATQIADSAMDYKAASAMADTKRNKADLVKLFAMNEEDTRRIRKMIEQIENGAKITLDTLQQSHETSAQAFTV